MRQASWTKPRKLRALYSQRTRHPSEEAFDEPTYNGLAVRAILSRRPTSIGTVQRDHLDAILSQRFIERMR